MPNFVKPINGQPLVSTNTEPLGASTLAPSAKELGLWDRYQLSKHQNKAQVELEKVKTNALKAQAIALTERAAEMQGSLINAEMTRAHGESLGAIGAVMYDNYKVMTLEQAASRQAGHIANTQLFNEHLGDAQGRLSRGEFSEGQARIAMLTADALMAETEARQDARYKQLTDATDRNFDAAFKPIQNRSSRN